MAWMYFHFYCSLLLLIHSHIHFQLDSIWYTLMITLKTYFIYLLGAQLQPCSFHSGFVFLHSFSLFWKSDVFDRCLCCSPPITISSEILSSVCSETTTHFCLAVVVVVLSVCKMFAFILLWWAVTVLLQNEVKHKCLSKFKYEESWELQKDCDISYVDATCCKIQPLPRFLNI